METCKCFDRRYCPQYVTSANGYTLLTKPITKKSRNRNLQQRWIWFCKYFAKVCRTLWCHCNWSLFIKYHQNISPSSYLNTSFVWTYIPLALKKKRKKKYRTSKTILAYRIPQCFVSILILIRYLQFCSEVFSSIVNEVIRTISSQNFTKKFCLHKNANQTKLN